MKLEQMKFNNFRQFYGEQTIKFTREAKRNVTVITGVNGAGKTSCHRTLKRGHLGTA